MPDILSLYQPSQHNKDVTKKEETQTIDIRTAAFIGFNGTIGTNIAGIFASFGRTKLYCAGRDIEKVRKAISRIIRSVRADAIEDGTAKKSARRALLICRYEKL